MKIHHILRKREKPDDEDFPNGTMVSHQGAKISYQAHCKLSTCIYKNNAEIKYISVVKCLPYWI
jgi:hypothetical protein